MIYKQRVFSYYWDCKSTWYSVCGRRSCRLTDRRSGSSFQERDFRIPACLSRITNFSTGHESPLLVDDDGTVQRNVTLYIHGARKIQLTAAILRLVVQLVPRLHDQANIEQTSSKCIQNTRANCSTFARRLLDVC